MPRTSPYNHIPKYLSISLRKRPIFFPLILAVLLLFSRQSLFGQHAPRQLFFVVSLPAVTHYNPGKLNAELASLKDKESVLALIRSKNFPPAKILIGIQKDSSNSIPWTIYTSLRGPVRDDNRIILQSKDIPVSRITDPAIFKSVLRDTIGVIDSLVQEIDIRDEDFPPDGYRVRSGCQADGGVPASVLYIDGHLIFSPRSIHACPGGLPAVKLYNTGTHIRCHFRHCRQPGNEYPHSRRNDRQYAAYLYLGKYDRQSAPIRSRVRRSGLRLFLLL